MKSLNKENNDTGRREFITKLSVAAAMGLIGLPEVKGSPGIADEISLSQTAGEMPTINLGPHRISRLLVGSNPLLGYSYMGPHSDAHMKEYYTTERTVEMLLSCEKAGITVHQSSNRLDYFPLLREKGSRMKIITLLSDAESIRETIDVAKPIALVHHGGATDRSFATGKAQVVHDFVKKVKDKGLLAGVSAHNPDNIKRIADEGWEVDFFMTCFYYLTRPVNRDETNPVLPVGSYNFYRDDPKRMTEVVRQVGKPCLGFKILGAGRQCSSQEKVKAAFRFAFENIKPTDGVIVGMFPWKFDEIGVNAGYVKELGKL